MRFMVSRTSNYGQCPPCEGARQETYLRVDERTVDDPAKLNLFENETDWYGLGCNHRIENGHIKRDYECKGYFIDIANLEELLAFMDTHGPIVIQKTNTNPQMREIEIYDDYRE